MTRHPTRFALGAVLLIVGGLCVALPVAAAELTRGDDAIGVPSVGRVLLAFAVTAALAVGIVFMLKRAMPKFGASSAAGSVMRVVDRIHVSRTLQLHLLRINEQTVLVAESRTGVAIQVMPVAPTVDSHSES
jgi:hypothetical protein